jgi:hypothetical protein
VIRLEILKLDICTLDSRRFDRFDSDERRVEYCRELNSRADTIDTTDLIRGIRFLIVHLVGNRNRGLYRERVRQVVRIRMVLDVRPWGAIR